MSSMTLEDLTTKLNFSDVKWKRLTGSPNFSYYVDYSIAILSTDCMKKTVQFLGEWAPHAYCHFHRHLGDTTSIVLRGEHYVKEYSSATKFEAKTRTEGHVSKGLCGDAHMEKAGANGSLVYFSMECEKGNVFEILDESLNTLNVLSFQEFINGKY